MIHGKAQPAWQGGSRTRNLTNTAVTAHKRTHFFPASLCIIEHRCCCSPSRINSRKMVASDFEESSHETRQSFTIDINNLNQTHGEDGGRAQEVSDNDDDDMTVIILEHGIDNDHAPVGWSDPDSPEMEERRRNVLLRELQRVQRASFIHFMILCLIPTSLLFIVLATVLGEEDNCESTATTCMKEARTFMNAFTTRCVCEAITVVQGSPP